jgi:hypothetical protein
MSEKFDIYSKIFFRDVGNFFQYLCELVLRHQMRVSNYFVNSFYSVCLPSSVLCLPSSVRWLPSSVLGLPSSYSVFTFVSIVISVVSTVFLFGTTVFDFFCTGFTFVSTVFTFVSITCLPSSGQHTCYV